MNFRTLPKQLAHIAGSVAALSMLAPAPAAAEEDGILTPICANGVIIYMRIDLNESDEAPNKPPQHNSACHGACSPVRKSVIKGRVAG